MAIATQQLPTGTFTVDPIHSTVGFEVTHMVVSKFRGNFHTFAARLDTTDGRPRLRGEVEVSSLDVRSPDLAAHLLSPEFFDVDRSPQLIFETDDLRVAEDGTVALSGEITIKGVTKPVIGQGRVYVIEADITGNERVGLVLEATVDRREFGLLWNAPLPKGGFALGNDVTIEVALELVPEA